MHEAICTSAFNPSVGHDPGYRQPRNVDASKQKPVLPQEDLGWTAVWTYRAILALQGQAADTIGYAEDTETWQGCSALAKR